MGAVQPLRGKRFSISGSAGALKDGGVDLALLRRCHSFVRHLTLRILEAGGDLVIFLGAEPRIDPTDSQTGKVFYWTQVEAIVEYLSNSGQIDRDHPVLHAVVAMERNGNGIPEPRQALWQQLLAQGAVELKSVPARLDFGGHHRERQAEVADVLVSLGGGKGVFDLERRFRERGDSVIPLDARIGSSCGDGEASRDLNREALQSPERFVPAAMASWFLSQLPLLSFQGDTPPEELARRVLEVLKRLVQAPAQQQVEPAAPVSERRSSRKLAEHLHFLVLADEWLPRKGGISTVNRDLCRGLVRAGHQVSLFAPRTAATAIDSEKLQRESGICLVHSQKPPLHDDPELFLMPALKQPPDVIIGHGHVTGPAARAQREEHFSSSLLVHFVHVSSVDIEHHKGKAPASAMRDGEGKDRQQAELAARADLVVAVGPRLKRGIEQSMYSWNAQAPVFEFLPWMPGHDPVQVPGERAALWIGRAGAAHLKGLDLAARAMARISAPSPILHVRGVDAQDAELLQKQLQEWSNRKVLVRLEEYAPESERIEASFRRASVVLMPSRSEGFGMVGLEAIARGIPTLVSSKSGLAELLQTYGGEPGKAAVVSITQDADESSENLYLKLRSIWESPDAAFAQARMLREQLAMRLEESQMVQAFLEALRTQAKKKIAPVSLRT